MCIGLSASDGKLRTRELQRHPRLLECTVIFDIQDLAPNSVYRSAEICMRKCMCAATDSHSMHKIIAHTYVQLLVHYGSTQYKCSTKHLSVSYKVFSRVTIVTHFLDCNI